MTTILHSQMPVVSNGNLSISTMVQAESMDSSTFSGVVITVILEQALFFQVVTSSILNY